MKVFGTKQVKPTYQDLAAAARLSAVAARFKPAPGGDVVVEPDSHEKPQEQPTE